MPQSCLVKECKNMSGGGMDVHFHRPPVNDPKMCQEWLLRSGMSPEAAAAATMKQCRSWRICSAHFQGTRQSTGTFLPTINIPDYERTQAAINLLQLSTHHVPQPSTSASDMTEAETQNFPIEQSVSGEQESSVNITESQTSSTGVNSGTDLGLSRGKRRLFKETDTQVTPNPNKVRTPPASKYTDITPKGKRSIQSNTELKFDRNVQTELPSKLFTMKRTVATQTSLEISHKNIKANLKKIEIVKHSDKELRKLTRIESYGLFEILHKYLISKCSDDTCTIQGHTDDPSKIFPHISTENQILLVLYKLKRNPIDSVLASEFNVSTGRISEIFKFRVKRMYRKFKIIKIWPSKETVQKHMPSATKQHFSDLVAKSDCVEFSSQFPKGPLPGELLFSNYKNCHTVKVMYSTAPNGALIHCSDAYGGNSSDKEIFAQSDIASRLQPGDGLMVDKGFLIKDCIQGKDIRLYRPPFLSEKKILTLILVNDILVV